jgi:hypothetical protein
MVIKHYYQYWKGIVMHCNNIVFRCLFAASLVILTIKVYF